MRTLVMGAVVAVVTLSLGGQAMAGDRFSPDRIQPLVRKALDAGALKRQPQSAAGRSGQRDSIWNGGLIGAAIGGVGGSALIVASHGGSDNIGRAMLNVCVPPALAGFAVGAIVDALR